MCGGVAFTEREAWAFLVRVANGANPVLVRAVQRYGPVETAERVVRDDIIAYQWAPVPWPDAGARDLAAIERFGGQLITPADRDWPAEAFAKRPLNSRLATRVAPVALWVWGSTSLAAALRPVAVSVIGTRAATAYGTRVAADLTRDLLAADIGVATTGDRGIGAAVIARALSTDASRLLVPVHEGLDTALKSRNGRLLRAVGAGGGLVLSEFAPGTVPSRKSKADRARLMSLLTAGTVVVEAGALSSVIGQAELAGMLGGFVGAVPGTVTSPQSAGTHAMLREHAEIVVGVGDVCRLLDRAG